MLTSNYFSANNVANIKKKTQHRLRKNTPDEGGFSVILPIASAAYGPYGPPRYDTEDDSMGKLGLQRAQIGPYAPHRRRIWLGLA